MIRINKSLGKFQTDILWNIVSFGIMGVSGIILNIMIGIYYDAETLGIFNQVYAAYIFISQFAVGGIHLSTLKHVAEFSNDKKTISRIIIASLLLTFFLSLLFSSIFFFSKSVIGSLLNSKGVTTGIVWASPGLFFFAINKVLLSILNGLRRMKIFAVFQGLRYILIITSLIFCIILSFSGEKLVVVLSSGEVILFFILIIILRNDIIISETSGVFNWIKKHFDFGFKSFFSGVLMELNSRIDVLMLGYFLSDKIVGVYSFAAILAEGLFQLLIVLRTNYNPLLVKLIAEKKYEDLKKIIVKGKLITYGIMLPVIIIAIFIYPYAVDIIMENNSFVKSWPVFSILLIGILISSGYIPFSQILLQAGKPGLHTMMITILVLFNIIFNYVLIPVFGINGAAFATSGSFVLNVALIIIITKGALGIIV